MEARSILSCWLNVCACARMSVCVCVHAHKRAPERLIILFGEEAGMRREGEDKKQSTFFKSFGLVAIGTSSRPILCFCVHAPEIGRFSGEL